jgi:hypothetical protein
MLGSEKSILMGNFMQINKKKKGENAICPGIKRSQAPSCHGI